MKHISKIQSGTNLFPLNTVQANNKQPKTNVLNSVDVIHIFFPTTNAVTATEILHNSSVGDMVHISKESQMVENERQPQIVFIYLFY